MITLGKRGRGIDPSVLGWLMATLQTPGVGDVHFLTGVDSQYYSWLRDEMKVHSSKIHHSLAAGEDALTANRNDCLLAYPDTYTVTASLDWDKGNTHLIGLGGPLSRGGMSEGVYFNCETTDVEELIDVIGHNCQFHNFQLRNDYADADNLSALKMSAGRNFFGKNLHLVGQCATTQTGEADNCALWFYSTGALRPWGAKFVDCKIGDAGEYVRTAGAVIYFSGTTGSTLKDVEFDNCRIVGSTETDLPAVGLSANYCIDRYLLFKDCLFYNYSVNNVNQMTQVFQDVCGTTHHTVLMGSCIAVGYTDWDQSALNYTFGNMSIYAANSGIGTKLAT